MDFDLVFEPQRTLEVATHQHARPADPPSLRGAPELWGPAVDGKAEGAEEGMLGHFHVTEVTGEVDDPCHVGVRELDPVGHFELVGHRAFAPVDSAGG